MAMKDLNNTKILELTLKNAFIIIHILGGSVLFVIVKTALSFLSAFIQIVSIPVLNLNL